MTDRKKSIYFIINPISGINGKKQIVRNIEKFLDRQLFDWQIKYTEYAGHATDIAREAAAAGVDVAVAVGGDGTVNEVARSLVHSQTALGIIPCGSGNGLARHLQISTDSVKAIKTLNKMVVRELDYGLINDIPFFCTCGVGFDAFVSSKFAHAGKRGLLTYLENTLREGLVYRPDTYRLTIDDNQEMEYKAFLIACANASQYGNNAYIAPGASMSDGLMDVTIMEPISVLEAPQIAIQLFNKTLDHNSKIKTFKCKKVHIRRDAPGVIHYDGDPTTTGEDILVELIHKGLKVVINDLSEGESPLLRVFTDFYNELNQFRDGLIQQPKKIIKMHQQIHKNLVDRKNIFAKKRRQNDA